MLGVVFLSCVSLPCRVECGATYAVLMEAPIDIHDASAFARDNSQLRNEQLLILIVLRREQRSLSILFALSSNARTRNAVYTYSVTRVF